MLLHLYKGEHPENVKEILHTKYIFNPQSAIKEAEKSIYRTAKNYGKASANKMLRKLFLQGWKKAGNRLSDFDLAWSDPRGYNADSTKRFR